MAAWNRLSYMSQNNSGSFPIRRDLNGKGISQQLNSTGLDSGSGRRASEQSVSRRISQQQATPCSITDGGFLSNRSTLDMVGHGLMPSSHAAESLLNNHGQHHEDAFLGPGRVRQLSAAGYNFLSQKKDQFADGPVSMYQGQDPVSRGGLIDMGLGVNGGLSSEVTGKDFRYVGQEEANFAQASACESLRDVRYGGRPLYRESYVAKAPGYSGGEEDPLVPPMSPRVMPMSPRKDELVLTMMSPRRDEVNPTDPYGDIPRMMSPRRDDLSPTLKPARRDFLNMGLIGNSRSTREEELLQHQDFPMSPRREAAGVITPPMSPRVGWDYEAAPSLSTPNLPVPVPYSPPTSPSWRDGVKPPHSQWDLLPGKLAVWNGNEREGRIEDNRAYRTDIFTRVPQSYRQNGNYRTEMDNFRDDYRVLGQGQGQGWSSSARWGFEDGLLVRPEEQDGLYRPPMVYGLGQMGRNFSDHSRDSHHITNAKQFAYNSGMNQRVGMNSGYIRRDRNQQSVAGRVKTNHVDLSRKRYNNGYAGNSKPLRTDRQEKAVRSTAVNSKNVKKNEKNDVGVSDKKSVSLVAAIENASKQSNEERTGDKPNGNKSSNVDSSVGAASTIGNDNNTSQPVKVTAPGISSRLSNTVTANESPENLKKDTGNAGDAQKKKEAGTHDQVHQNGLPTNPSKGNGQVNSKTETKPGETTREVRKRPSLVTEIERAKRSRTFAEQRRRYRELEETYYDADELSLELLSKMNKSGSRYPRAFNDDPYLRRRQQGGQTSFHCLFCGKLRSLVRPNHGHMRQGRSQRFCTCRLG